MMTMTITTTMAMILMRMSTVSSPVLIFIVCFIILIFVVLFVCFSFAMIFLILFIFFFCLLFLSFIFFIFFTLHLQSSLFSASSLLLRVHLFSSYSHYLLHFLMRWSGWWVISLADLSPAILSLCFSFRSPPLHSSFCSQGWIPSYEFTERLAPKFTCISWMMPWNQAAGFNGISFHR